MLCHLIIQLQFRLFMIRREDLLAVDRKLQYTQTIDTSLILTNTNT